MNTVKFENIKSIFNNVIFAIPDYQRDYSWGRSEVGTLLDDIRSLYSRNKGGQKEATHFCGSIVVIEYDGDMSRNTRATMQDKAVRHYEKMNVIDGQQRLTTLSLLLVALKKCADSKGIDLKGVKGLLDTDENDANGREISVMNFADIDTQECYKEILYGRSNDFNKGRAGAKHLLENYQCCRSFVEDICEADGYSRETLAGIVDQVVYYLTFVPVSCDNGVDAFQIFESLNATGLNLTPAEQVKNLMLMYSSDTDQCLSQWDSIVSCVGEKGLVEFLSHYLFFKERSRIPKKDIYSKFKDMVKVSGGDVSMIMANLTFCAGVYAKLKNPSAGNPASPHLLDFKDLGQVQAYVPLLASAMRFDVDSKEFKQVADALLVFIVRHVVCGQSSNKLDAVFGKALNVIGSGSHQDVIEFFAEQRQRDSDFEKFFEILTFEYSARPQAVARTILRRIEESEHGASHPFRIDRSGLTNEHIIPKKPSKKVLAEWIGEKAANERGFDLSVFINETVKSIGNMALLFDVQNSKIGNKGYQEKVIFYTHEVVDSKTGEHKGIPTEAFVLLSELVEDYPNEFAEEQVRSRARALAKKAVRAWS